MVKGDVGMDKRMILMVVGVVMMLFLKFIVVVYVVKM